MIKEIQCFDDKMGSAEQAITQYCFVTGTFTVPGRCLLWLMKMALILEDLIEDSMQSNDHDFIWVDEHSLSMAVDWNSCSGDNHPETDWKDF